jgi:hypothetical protein
LVSKTKYWFLIASQRYPFPNPLESAALILELSKKFSFSEIAERTSLWLKKST